MKISKDKITQGDVTLYRVKTVPTEAKPLDTKILQQSETKGRHHYFLPTAEVTVLETGVVPLADTITPDTGKFIITKGGAVLYHGIPSKTKEGKPIKDSNDHEPIVIPDGMWQVVIAREWDYDANEIIQTAD